ncbi:hypothetical protein E2C01_084800 [Portunus trituberculatus]|uniref:Uncharacterized protein n=1 Tax=Portunus trituberculatus TaxID=210409 RepID=A0A5B7J541_PORTR|nr:hypothetical protein [Portunus trituberculatus]
MKTCRGTEGVKTWNNEGLTNTQIYERKKKGRYADGNDVRGTGIAVRWAVSVTEEEEEEEEEITQINGCSFSGVC